MRVQSEYRMENKFDVVIIGGGPGGVSAALYTARGGLSTCVIHSGESALHKAHLIENYYGAVATGAELYARGIEQARGVGATVLSDQATFVEYDGNGFAVSTAANGVIYARRLIVATGAARARADIEGIDEFDGKGVSYCAVCDAFFYRKKRVGVVGAGEFAAHEYGAISAVASETYLFTDGAQASFSAPLIVDKKIARAYAREDGRLGGVEFVDGERIELDGLFVALGVMGSSALAKSVGVLTDKRGAVVTDAQGMTNIKGLYAVGDCTAGIKQVGKAVSDGVIAGMSVIADIKAERRA